MLTVTDEARSHLSELLTKAQAPEDAAVRLVPGQQGLELTLDREQPGDTTFSKDEQKVLLVGESIASHLDEATLDIENTDSGPRLAIT